jgi:hypothetical protein
MNVSALKIITRQVKVNKDLGHVTSFMTGAPQLGSWLSPVKSVDAVLGGRIEFRAETGFEHGATYHLLNLPEHVVILSDKFGEIDVQIEESNGKSIVNFTFSKADDDDYEKIVSDTVTRFIAMVNY